MREFKEVIDETRRTAIMNPLSRNADTAYFYTDGSPCCIVGHALDRLGVAGKHFSPGGVGSNIYTVGDLPWVVLGFTLPNDYQLQWLSAVQVAADGRAAWLKAVVGADARLASW